MKMTVSMHPRAAATRQPVARGRSSSSSGLLQAGSDAERVLVDYQKEQNLRFGDAAVRSGPVDRSRHSVRVVTAVRICLSAQDRRATRSPVSDELVAAYEPFSPRVEELRAIRSQLMLRWFSKEQRRQVLTIVGAERGEGRSYLAANLAVVFAQLGERTLLIDADLRAPRQHLLFSLENRVGFSTLLAGRSQGEAVVRVGALPGLSVLPAGPTPPNPLELLNRVNFDELLIECRSAYDVVIVDTPALSTGEDAAMVAVRTGSALAVARCGTTRMAAFSDLVQGLQDTGVAVVGSVLNEVPVKKPAR